MLVLLLVLLMLVVRVTLVLLVLLLLLLLLVVLLLLLLVMMLLLLLLLLLLTMWPGVVLVRCPSVGQRCSHWLLGLCSPSPGLLHRCSLHLSALSSHIQISAAASQAAAGPQRAAIRHYANQPARPL